MRLSISTPLAQVIDLQGVVHVRAEDSTGAFGIRRGHTELLTALAISVVSWRTEDGREGHCAVRGGVLTVHGGREVGVATREAVAGDDLAALEAGVLRHMRAKHEQEAQARTEATEVRVAAVRKVLEYLRAGSPG